MKKNEVSVGFIGCGNMAQAIIRALSDNNYTNLFAADPSPEQLEKVFGIAKTTTSNQEIISNSKYIFLCIKPQNAKEVLMPLDFGDKIPISIMAGLTLEKIIEFTKTQKIVRVMPNLNASVKLSYSAFCCKNLSEKEKSEISGLLLSFGMAAEINEPQMNAVTGIAGSGPAYLFRFFKGLLCEAEKHGFSSAEAVEMCGMMIAGSVGTILHSVFKTPPADFKEALEKLDAKTDSVCSKGGTTIEGIKYLDENKFSEIIETAASKAVKRAEELSK